MGLSLSPARFEVQKAKCDGGFTFDLRNAQEGVRSSATFQKLHEGAATSASNAMMQVDTLNLDDLLEARYGTDLFIPIVKIDTEGSEIDVLHSMRRAIASGKIRNIVMELMPRSWQKKKISLEEGAKFLDWLVMLGFTPMLLEDGTNWGSLTMLRGGPSGLAMKEIPKLFTLSDFAAAARNRADQNIGANIFFSLDFH